MNKSTLACAWATPVLLIGTCASAQTASRHADAMTHTSAEAVAPDNTKSNSNKVDPSNRQDVADKQSNGSTDVDLTKRIRRSVVGDKKLSTYAHNVKIVAVDGKVTLNGVVKSDEEKTEIEKKATAIAGPGKVVDEIKVASSK